MSSAHSKQRDIKPEGKKRRKRPLLKWLFFSFFVIVVLIIYYHASILTYIGRGLIVEDPPEKSDMIVCLGGGNIERGIATADAYKKGLAEKVLLTRPYVPDAYELLKAKKVSYPEEADLLETLLVSLGVPEAAIIRSDVPVYNTLDEAESVRKIIEKTGARSLIIITSPMHSRRAWLSYRKVFKNTDVRILSMPSGYYKFSPDTWWKGRWYLKEVLMEYEKLIYYIFKYHLYGYGSGI